MPHKQRDAMISAKHLSHERSRNNQPHTADIPLRESNRTQGRDSHLRRAATSASDTTVSRLYTQRERFARQDELALIIDWLTTHDPWDYMQYASKRSGEIDELTDLETPLP